VLGMLRATPRGFTRPPSTVGFSRPSVGFGLVGFGASFGKQPALRSLIFQQKRDYSSNLSPFDPSNFKTDTPKKEIYSGNFHHVTEWQWAHRHRGDYDLEDLPRTPFKDAADEKHNPDLLGFNYVFLMAITMMFCWFFFWVFFSPFQMKDGWEYFRNTRRLHAKWEREASERRAMKKAEKEGKKFIPFPNEEYKKFMHCFKPEWDLEGQGRRLFTPYEMAGETLKLKPNLLKASLERELKTKLELPIPKNDSLHEDDPLHEDLPILNKAPRRRYSPSPRRPQTPTRVDPQQISDLNRVR